MLLQCRSCNNGPGTMQLHWDSGSTATGEVQQHCRSCNSGSPETVEMRMGQWMSCDSDHQSPCNGEAMMPASNDRESDDGWPSQHHLTSSSNWDQNNSTSCHGAGWRSRALQIHPKVWLPRAGQGQANILKLDMSYFQYFIGIWNQVILCWTSMEKSKSSSSSSLEPLLNQGKYKTTLTLVVHLNFSLSNFMMFQRTKYGP